ncbi:MAG: hypothetical protein LC754_00130 [Acidobacteria bacterium]|nr:hypothetical protein [Acidobacteriota bacterium]
MEQNITGEDSTRHYLLGDLPAEERRPLEERLLADGDFLKYLSAVEDDLVDEYVRGELSEGERERFESFFLITAERRRKVKFAQALRRYNEPALTSATSPAMASTPKRAWWRALLSGLRIRRPVMWLPAAAACLLLAALSAYWVMVRHRPPRGGPELSQGLPAPNRQPDATPQETPPAGGQLAEVNDAVPVPSARDGRKPADTAREGRVPPDVPRPATVVVLSPVLISGSVRGEGGAMQPIVVPPNAGRVRLRLALPARDYETYDAVLISGERSTRIPGARVVGKVEGRDLIAVELPADKLPYGEYQLRLSGRNQRGESHYVDTYSFRVKTKYAATRPPGRRRRPFMPLR